jgi:2-polyprenyl-3-methyl-5-hydroxy-6-metoxy-1,4-benzoquinol methylase
MTTTDPSGEPVSTAPSLTALPAARDELEPLLARMLDLAERVHHNQQGGDLSAFRNERSLVRNLANYVAAASLADTIAPAGPVVDFGSGTGLLGGWLARRTGRPITLVDADQRLLDLGRRLLPGVATHTSLEAVAPGSVALLTAMEVIEHIPPAEQRPVTSLLLSRLAPGGVLVVSTPDERGYLGGASRYGPHIGVLTAEELADLLPAGGGWRSAVWRLESPLHTLSPVSRVLGPLGNGTWAALERRAPALAGAIAARAAEASRRRPRQPLPADHLRVRAVPAAHGTGDGMLGVAVRPSQVGDPEPGG